jgi:transposase InsO family protein
MTRRSLAHGACPVDGRSPAPRATPAGADIADLVITVFASDHLGRVLDRLEAERGLPEVLRVDNGPEFLSQILVDWAKDKRVLIQYIQPGKPNQSAYIERFNRTYRAMKCWTCISSVIWTRCGRSRVAGSLRTTSSGHTTPWADWRPRLTPTKEPESLLRNCLLDGEAYALTATPASASRRKPMICSSENRFFMPNLHSIMGLDSKSMCYSRRGGRRAGRNELRLRRTGIAVMRP